MIGLRSIIGLFGHYSINCYFPDPFLHHTRSLRLSTRVSHTLSGIFVSHIDLCTYPYSWQSTTYASDSPSATSIVSVYPPCQNSGNTSDLALFKFVPAMIRVPCSGIRTRWRSKGGTSMHYIFALCQSDVSFCKRCGRRGTSPRILP